MRRSTSAWTAAALGTALSASLLLAQQTSTGIGSDPAEMTPVYSPAAAGRAAAYLLRNGWDYLKYEEYERALSFFQEVEKRKTELSEAERQALVQGIERAKRGIRDGSKSAVASYTKSRPRAAAPFVESSPGEPIQLTSATTITQPGTPRPGPQPTAGMPALPTAPPPPITASASNAAPAPAPFNPPANSPSALAMAMAPTPLSPPASNPEPAAPVSAPAPLVTEPAPAPLPVADPTPLPAPGNDPAPAPTAPAPLPVPGNDPAPAPTAPAPLTLPGNDPVPAPTAPAPLTLPGNDPVPAPTAPAPLTLPGNDPAPAPTAPEVPAPAPPEPPAALPQPSVLPQAGASAPAGAPETAELPTAYTTTTSSKPAITGVSEGDSVALPPLSGEPSATDPVATTPPIPPADPTTPPVPPADETTKPATPAAAPAPTPESLPPLPQMPEPAPVPEPTPTPTAAATPEPSDPTPTPTLGELPLPPLPGEAGARPDAFGVTNPNAAGRPGPGYRTDGFGAPRIASGGVEDAMIPDRPALPPSTLSPDLQREVDRIAQKQEDDLRRNATSNREPAADMPSAGGAPSTRLEISRAPSPTEARPIRAIPVPDEFTPLPPRSWDPNRKYWAAAATCHMPLYFQDASLERYGHSTEQFFGPVGKYLTYPLDDPKQSNQRNQLTQPFFSAGLFFAQIVLLPYNLVMDPPWEAEYDLGFQRPGDRIPTDTYYLPVTGVGPPLQGSRY